MLRDVDYCERDWTSALPWGSAVNERLAAGRLYPFSGPMLYYGNNHLVVFSSPKNERRAYERIKQQEKQE